MKQLIISSQSVSQSIRQPVHQSVSLPVSEWVSQSVSQRLVKTIVWVLLSSNVPDSILNAHSKNGYPIRAHVAKIEVKYSKFSTPMQLYIEASGVPRWFIMVRLEIPISVKPPRGAPRFVRRCVSCGALHTPKGERYCTVYPLWLDFICFPSFNLSP